MAAPRGGTRERLLDAAEKLFAEHGYDATSTRDIAALSGDTIGSVNYHFGSKYELHAEVIRRRATVINEARKALLDRIASDESTRPELQAIVSALVVPYLDRAINGDEGWRNYARLASRVGYSPQWYREVVSDLYDPLSKEFIKLIQQAVDGATYKDAGYAFNFALGCLLHCSADLASCRLNRLTNDVCDAANYDEICSRLVTFCTEGMRVVLAAGATTSASPRARARPTSVVGPARAAQSSRRRSR